MPLVYVGFSCWLYGVLICSAPCVHCLYSLLTSQKLASEGIWPTILPTSSQQCWSSIWRFKFGWGTVMYQLYPNVRWCTVCIRFEFGSRWEAVSGSCQGSVHFRFEFGSVWIRMCGLTRPFFVFRWDCKPPNDQASSPLLYLCNSKLVIQTPFSEVKED